MRYTVSKREKIAILALIGAVMVAYVLAFLGCHTALLDVVECTDLLEWLSYYIFAPSSVSFAGYMWFEFCKKHRVFKDHLTFTGIFTCIAVMAALVISLITTTYHMTIFCITLVIIWLSLSDTHRFWQPIARWSVLAAFLIFVIVCFYRDIPVVISLLYAMFTGWATLRKTGAHRFSEYGACAVVAAIFVLSGIMGYDAVDEMGMPGEGQEVWILIVGMLRADPYVDGVMIVVASVLGLGPFFYMIAKGSRNPSSRA